MIANFDIKDIDSLMNLWLETSISAHHFISSDYWEAHVDKV